MTDQRVAEPVVFLVMPEGRGQPAVHSVHRDAWAAIGTVFDELGSSFEARSFGPEDHQKGLVFVAYESQTGTWWKVYRRVIED